MSGSGEREWHLVGQPVVSEDRSELHFVVGDGEANEERRALYLPAGLLAGLGLPEKPAEKPARG